MNINKCLVKSLFLIALVLHLRGNAQIVSLSNKEIVHLKDLIINKDPLATSCINKWKTIANKALEETPSPVDTIFSQGILANNPKKIKTKLALDDIDKVYSLAIMYRISSQTNYLNKAAEYLKAWTMSNKPQGNPINETKLDGLIEAYDLLKDFVDSETNKSFLNWLRILATKEAERNPSNNNFNSHRIKIYGQAAIILNDTILIKQAVNELSTHIGVNLLADSSSFDFVRRDALHYHIYTLEPMLKLAYSIKRGLGKDFYQYTSPTSSSLRNSIYFLIPYLNCEKKHEEFVKSTVAFDKARADNGERAYQKGALFQPKSARLVMAQAQYFDSSLKVSIQLDDWQLLINKITSQ